MNRKPKRFEDRELRSQYTFDNGRDCEISSLLSYEDNQRVAYLRGDQLTGMISTHHIFHRFQQRRDLKSNLICIDSIVHQPWGHDGHPIQLTICCLYAKFRKSFTDASEFDIEELHDCLASCPIAWLEDKIERFDDKSVYRRYSQEMIDCYS